MEKMMIKKEQIRRLRQMVLASSNTKGWRDLILQDFRQVAECLVKAQVAEAKAARCEDEGAKELYLTLARHDRELANTILEGKLKWNAQTMRFERAWQERLDLNK